MCKCKCNPFDQSDPCYEAWLSDREKTECAAKKKKEKGNERAGK